MRATGRSAERPEDGSAPSEHILGPVAAMAARRPSACYHGVVSYVVHGAPRAFRPLGARPPDLARKILREHGVERPPVPVNHLAHQLGVEVWPASSLFEGPLDGEERARVFGIRATGLAYLRSAALTRSDVAPPTVWLHDWLPSDHRRIALAHSLGHILLHPPGVYAEDSFSGSVEESEANEFAVSLLAPLWMLEPLVSSRPPNADELSSLFDVPHHPMNVQLANLMDLPVRW